MEGKYMLQTKLMMAVLEVNNALEARDLAEARLDKARTIRDKIKSQLEDLDVVQVAYLTTPAGRPLTNPIANRETFDYIDSTEKGLAVGNIVVAPTRYNRYQEAVVVAVGEPRTYFGKLNRITEVLYP